MTYEEALQKINSRLRFGIKPGLERIEALCKKLGNPQKKPRFVHVAGTNGKGTTCTLIASVLTAAGYRTGLYTSPYVLDFRERFRIDGEMIPEAELIEEVKRVSPVADELEAAGDTVTEFEFITALAFDWFAQRDCDFVVLEVGLGGRFDATNVIDTPEAAAIASISLDHTAILGDTYAKIAFEKAGIIKKDGDVVLLQNTRFRKEETKNVEEFSKELASLADCYVDDAFGSCHRAHCSTEGVTKFLSPCVAGYLIGKELAVMGKALENADRPFVAVLGGAKIEDKLNVINNLLEKVDTLIIGGGMAFTFLKAKGYEIGKSLLDETKIDYCKDMMAKAAEKGVQLLLPVDTVCIKDFPNPIDAPVDTVTVDADAIPADMEGCDIGPKSRELFAAAVKSAKTVVWNGPMGVFENPTLAAGTLAVAQAMADSDAVTIIGGGDSAAAVEQMGLGDKMTHISTGGGASLEYLEGKTLPGVACLDEK